MAQHTPQEMYIALHKLLKAGTAPTDPHVQALLDGLRKSGPVDPGPELPSSDLGIKFDRAGNALGHVVDSAGHAIAVPGRPDLNLEALADRIGAPGTGLSGEPDAAHSTTGQRLVGDILGRGIEGSVAANAVAPIAAGVPALPLIRNGERTIGDLRSAITGAAAGVGATPDHPLAGAGTGAGAGAILGDLTRVPGQEPGYIPPGGHPTDAQQLTAGGFHAPADLMDVQSAQGGGMRSGFLARLQGGMEGAAPSVQRNIAISDEALSQAAGMKPGSFRLLSADQQAAALDKALEPYRQVYQQIQGKVPAAGISADPTLMTEMNQAGNELTRATGPVPQRLQSMLDLAKGQPGTVSLNGQQMLDDIRLAREEAARFYKGGDATQEPFGDAWAGAARALERFMGRQIEQHPEWGINPADFQAARQGYAINRTVAGALRGRSFDPQVLNRLNTKEPDLLTGNLRYVATQAGVYPQAFGLPAKNVPGATFYGSKPGIVRYLMESVAGANAPPVPSPEESAAIVNEWKGKPELQHYFGQNAAPDFGESGWTPENAPVAPRGGPGGGGGNGPPNGGPPGGAPPSGPQIGSEGPVQFSGQQPPGLTGPGQLPALEDNSPPRLPGGSTVNGPPRLPAPGTIPTFVDSAGRAANAQGNFRFADDLQAPGSHPGAPVSANLSANNVADIGSSDKYVAPHHNPDTYVVQETPVEPPTKKVAPPKKGKPSLGDKFDASNDIEF